MFIYEIKRDYSNRVIGKNKHTVVYENKTYYYCKVNGTDILRSIPKREVNVPDGKFFKSREDTLELDEELRQNLKNKKIKELKLRIDMVEKSIDRSSKVLEHLKSELAQLES